MICKNCGKEIVNDSRFCEHCGKKTHTTKYKKTILWIVVGVVIALAAIIVGINLYYHSDAYEINYIKRIYSIDIPKGFEEQYYHHRILEYTDGKRGIINISGGNVFHWKDSLSAWFDYCAENESLSLPKELYVQTTINQIPAMYAIGIGSDYYGYPIAYQEALLYSERTGCYFINCSYPTEKRDYYDEIMRNVIFSFREK